MTADFLETGDEAVLAPYDGTALRARFRTRIVLRRAFSAVRSPSAAELACAALRLPPLRALAHEVFFGRGSFPDIESAPSGRDAPSAAPEPAAAHAGAGR